MAEIKWMQEGPFGVMLHWSEATRPMEGEPEEDRNKMVDGFPVEKVCDTVAATGANWLIFTVKHIGDKYCAPNPYLESICPGHCSSRDLVRDIGECLKPLDIKLIAYLPSSIAGRQNGELRNAFGWTLDRTDKSEFMRRYTEFVRVYSESWGRLISGWWFDSAYERRRTNFTWGNDRFEAVDWGSAVRAGNPAAVYCLNLSAEIFQYVLEDEDYLAGEARHILVKPARPLTGNKQWHAVTWLDWEWNYSKHKGAKVGPMPGPRFSTDELLEYLYDCHICGGGVTLNVGIYQDGTLNQESVAQLTEVARRMKAVKEGALPSPDLWYAGKENARGDVG